MARDPATSGAAARIATGSAIADPVLRILHLGSLHRTEGPDLISELYRLVGFAVCHQLPERSFFVAGRQLPVCARDTGIYLGFLAAFVLIVWLEPGHPREMPPKWVMGLSGLFIAAMAFDGVTSYAGWRATTNDIRLATGLLTGFAIPPLVLGMLNFQLWRNGSDEHVLGRRTHQLAWLVAIPVVFVLARYPVPEFGPVYSTLTIVGVLLAFTSVNLIAVTLVPIFERRAERWYDVIPFSALAFALTVAELAAAGWLHAFALRVASS